MEIKIKKELKGNTEILGPEEDSELRQSTVLMKQKRVSFWEETLRNLKEQI